jgi:acyl carrier protein phosphodiesterase
MHRKIDSFTDSHPLTFEAKALFRSETRRFAGIALDVFYDHVLAKEWQQYSAMPLDEFTQRFYRALLERRHLLPERAAFVASLMIEHDWLGSYRDFESVRIAVMRMSGRLSRNGDMLRDSIRDLEQHYDALSRTFHDFFPELIVFAEEERQRYAYVKA